jgi:hypothetical protein
MAYTTIDDASEHFQVKLWTGNATTRTIDLDDNATMQPDFSWIKSRSNTFENYWENSTNGTNKYLRSNSSAAEETGTVITYNSTGFGIVTAGILAGGSAPSATAKTESWNGTSWSEVNDLNTARSQGAGAGIQTSGLVFSGSPEGDNGALTEAWDGTSFTEVADLATARRRGGGAGTASLALYFGGQGSPPKFTATEEWNAPDVVIKTVTDS